MISLLLPAMIIIGVSVLGVMILYSTVVQTDFRPATVEPFAIPGSSHPADDTLANQAELITTSRPLGSEWKLATLSDLSQVEELLDCLEANGIKGPEVHALANNCFAVRWK